MKRVHLVLGAISTALATASASLGDKETTINAAYGKRIETDGMLPGNEGHQYRKGNYTYTVIFRDGISVFEMYARANQADLSSTEIATFLKANAGGARWVLAGNTARGREWQRSDHKAKAAYFRLGRCPTLTVMEATQKSRSKK